MKLPTAVQDRGDAHETSNRRLLVAPARRGVRWTTQLMPFHRSASGTPAPTASVKYPTAVHAVGDVHDTPERTLSVAPTGLGVRCSDQAEAAAVSACARHSNEHATAAQTAASAGNAAPLHLCHPVRRPRAPLSAHPDTTQPLQACHGQTTSSIHPYCHPPRRAKSMLKSARAYPPPPDASSALTNALTTAPAGTICRSRVGVGAAHGMYLRSQAGIRSVRLPATVTHTASLVAVLA